MNTPMKVKWMVTQEKHETFNVGGKTLEEAQQNLAARGHFGEFRPMPIRPILNRDGSVTLQLGYKILMPVWTGYKTAPPQCQKEWDRMWKQLDKHEQLHLGLYYSGGTKLFDQIKESPEGSLNVKQLTELAQNIAKEIDHNGKQFDDRTDNGRTEGVFLDPPFGCRPMDF